MKGTPMNRMLLVPESEIPYGLVRDLNHMTRCQMMQQRCRYLRQQITQHKQATDLAPDVQAERLTYLRAKLNLLQFLHRTEHECGGFSIN